MSNRYSQQSRDRLDQCDPRLQRVLEAVLPYFDHSILTGHRNREDQEKAVAAGNSQVHWPNSRHNSQPSQAVDAAPYPIDWNDHERFVYFAGQVMATARSLGVSLRWGGDWNRNQQTSNERFRDLVHFELVEE